MFMSLHRRGQWFAVKFPNNKYILTSQGSFQFEFYFSVTFMLENENEVKVLKKISYYRSL